MALTVSEFADQDLATQFPELGDPAVIQSIIQGAGSMMPLPQPLTAEETQRLHQLRNRADRLSPLEFRPASSTAVPGNPFSVEMAPVTQGFQDVLSGVINAVRERRMAGDPEKAKAQADKAKSAQQRIEKIKFGTTEGGQRLPRALSEDDRAQIKKLERQAGRATRRSERWEGVTPELDALEERKVEADESEDAWMEFLQDVSPRVAQTMLDMRESEALGRMESEQIDQRHTNTLEEIHERHEDRMAEIAGETTASGGSSGGLPAALLSELGENVRAAQDLITGDINALTTEQRRLQSAMDDPATAEILSARLPEGVTIEQRLAQIPAEIASKQQQLKGSIEAMISVAASRNNLPEEVVGRLLGADMAGDESGGSGTGNSATLNWEEMIGGGGN